MSDTPTAPPPLAASPPDLDAPAALVDAWPNARPFRLDGWFERNGFTPLLTALFVFILAFVLFQVVIAPIVIGIGLAIDMVRSGQETAPDLAELLESLTERGGLLMTANTVGQVLGFGALAVLVARLHTRRVGEYLRIRTPDWPGFGLAALGWAVLYPAVVWTGQLNERIPQPEWLDALEQSQVDLLEGILLGGDLSTPFLFVVLALTPAICEELLFRGYLQRQVERRLGVVASILMVGVLFGLYHLRLSQLVPLSLLGIYLGYVVWATGSLWSGFLVHLLNNGLAVLIAGWARESPEVDLEALEAMSMPWYLGVLGLALAAGVAYLLYLRRRAVVGDTPDARPTEAAPPLSPTPLPIP